MFLVDSHLQMITIEHLSEVQILSILYKSRLSYQPLAYMSNNQDISTVNYGNFASPRSLIPTRLVSRERSVLPLTLG